MADSLDLSVIIPAYNEKRRILRTLRVVTDYLAAQKYSWEVVVVNDGSTDSTAEVVESAKLKNVRVAKYSPNRGKGYAVNYGFFQSHGKVILFCDADNATPFKEIEKFWEFIDDYPVVIGSRYLKDSHIKIKQPLGRRIISRLGNLLVQVLLLPGFPDTQCGFKMFQRSGGEEIFKRQTIWRWGFDMEILFIAKKRQQKIRQVPVMWLDQLDSRLQSSRASLTVLQELTTIRLNGWLGKYR
ncbi:MAG TPA: dolichyl-phosphate beta-glucosyltransferase [Candidatus Saccharimonadales bacterium]|nr:dolichyl-phosphate beta-glucosyltransferase [Candidatus Saccharimonadales bacterium]